MLLSSELPWGVSEPTLLSTFRRRTEEHPDRVLVAERAGDGWRSVTWGQARRRVDRLAQGLLRRGLADQPLMLLSGNSVEHLLLTLAAWTAGGTVVPTSVAYSLLSADHQKLRAMVELVQPGAVYAELAAFAPACATAAAGRVLLTSRGGLSGATTLDELEEEPTAELGRRCQSVSDSTLAKVLFTSGSTGTPKGVLNPHGLLAANQAQMAAVWPFLDDEPPVLVDWLPWSHTFGGNHNLGLVLAHGGSLYVDDGKPVPGLVERTVCNLTDVPPTLYFNVPAGYSALLPHLERDGSLAAGFFSRLRLGFFAAAALPQQLWDRLVKLAAEHASSMQMTTSWGLTETGPAATTAHYPISRSDVIGVPLPGVELKLVPHGDKTEVRVKGPNVTPGYHLRADLTSAAFDEEGFLRTGDAVELVDEEDPGQGLLFRGRLAEDFKLSTGTFVSVGTLRPALLSAAQGLLQDAVLTGQDGDAVGALVWLHADHLARCPGGQPEPELRQELVQSLERLAAAGAGSAGRVERLLVLTDPPQLDAGEITDKGYINQAAVRERRAADVARLHGPDHDARVVLLRPVR